MVTVTADDVALADAINSHRKSVIDALNSTGQPDFPKIKRHISVTLLDDR